MNIENTTDTGETVALQNRSRGHHALYHRNNVKDAIEKLEAQLKGLKKTFKAFDKDGGNNKDLRVLDRAALDIDRKLSDLDRAMGSVSAELEFDASFDSKQFAMSEMSREAPLSLKDKLTKALGEIRTSHRMLRISGSEHLVREDTGISAFYPDYCDFYVDHLNEAQRAIAAACGQLEAEAKQEAPQEETAEDIACIDHDRLEAAKDANLRAWSVVRMVANNECAIVDGCREEAHHALVMAGKDINLVCEFLHDEL